MDEEDDEDIEFRNAFAETTLSEPSSRRTKDEVVAGWDYVVQTASRVRTFGGADTLTKDEQELAPRTGQAPVPQSYVTSDDCVEDPKSRNEWPKIGAYVSSAAYSYFDMINTNTIQFPERPPKTTPLPLSRFDQAEIDRNAGNAGHREDDQPHVENRAPDEVDEDDYYD
jgi:hypothetical protein